MTRRALPRVLVALLVLVAVAAVLVLGVFPTRTWLSQREQTAEAQRQLTDIEQRIAVLQQRKARLEDPAEVEQLAREQFGYVLPGEELYPVLDAPPAPVTAPDGWPFTPAG